MDRIPAPPPPAKPRNESMNANTPGYRNRPNASANPMSQFSNAKSLFESFNTPAIRNGVSKIANNPLAQKAGIALAKNDTVRTAAVNAACKHTTGNEPDPMTNKLAHSSIKSMVRQFEDKPIMGMGSGTTPGDRTSQQSMGNNPPYNPSYTQMPETSFKPLTASQIDPFEYPPQLSSTYPHQLNTTDSFANRSKSTEPFSYGGLSSDYQQKKAAPSRPPPPKVSNSWSNPSLSSPETLTNKAHAIARYPYKGSHVDELNFDPGDTLLLEREMDDQWVAAINTRTGLSGIVPISFLDIRIPLAPSSVLPPRQQNIPLPTQTLPSPTSSATKIMKALYDYHSNVDGDLNFNAGDLIVVYEAVSSEWLSGSLKNKYGIFPIAYVQTTDGSDPPTPSTSTKTVIALYDYSSGVADDLKFSTGDVIEIVEELSTDWIKGRLHGAIGMVPLTYVRRN